ncbi:MAG TPA: site-specific tyrosine recombinase XerD [Bacteroidales bacterium]|nr:site-specific tyrosine recombinase XerD [Bacteroidales bacterium]HOU97324.1 site-specific tyrosine recombinase XerD [Bacteroidales bacterium]
MNWDKAIHDFKSYLKIEKSLSENSIEAYIHDVSHLGRFCNSQSTPLSPEQVSMNDIETFLAYLHDFDINPRSQARIISGIKAFYFFLELNDWISENPTILISTPRLDKKLPTILSVEEIDDLIRAVDVSKPDGHRNRAMLETLYSCGLRVSELVELKLNQLYFDEGFIKVIGKGNKERLVPISERAINEIQFYFEQTRNTQKIQRGYENYVFLNKNGKKLTRVMVFIIIKRLAEQIGLQKEISPHTFRHSFATHLVEGGADLRAVQQMLGHESIITTEIYTHIDKTYLKQVIQDYHPRS